MLFGRNMLWLAFPAAAAVFTQPNLTVVPDPDPGPDPGLWRGVHFLANGFEGKYPYASAEANVSLRQLVSTTNVPAIALSFVWYQNMSDTEIRPLPGGTPSGSLYSNASTPTDDELAATVSLAKDLGLRVVLRPMVDPDWRFHQASRTRTQIGLHFNETEWDRWFASYGRYLVRYARLGAAWGADAFCIGGELNTAQQQDASRYWAGLYNAVRKELPVGTPVFYSG